MRIVSNYSSVTISEHVERPIIVREGDTALPAETVTVETAYGTVTVAISTDGSVTVSSTAQWGTVNNNDEGFTLISPFGK